VDTLDPSCTTGDGEVFVNGATLHRLAFCVLDASPLADGIYNLRGQNRLIPGVPGERAMPKRATTTDYVLRMVVDGRYSVSTGAPMLDEIQGLRLAKDWLRGNLHTPPGGTSQRTVQVVFPWGGSRSCAAHTSIAFGQRVGPVQRALLTVSVPLGVVA
jgi:hypothetical protein